MGWADQTVSTFTRFSLHLELVRRSIGVLSGLVYILNCFDQIFILRVYLRVILDNVFSLSSI